MQTGSLSAVVRHAWGLLREHAQAEIVPSTRDRFYATGTRVSAAQAVGPLPSQPRRLKRMSRITIATSSEPMPRKMKYPSRSWM